ncbi:MAG TPA: hypothetical protein VMV47_13245 [Bacteroidales bacterium]|nr:hypothetical protein [Bacteroidales bacterium]
MFPEGFIKRISKQKYIESAFLLRSLEEPSPVSLRINPSKWPLKPAESIPVPWASSGYYLAKRPSYTADPLFHAGCYYPQEASSMFIEEVFKQFVDNSEPIKVLDLCGAPGGKSTHLSDLIGPGNLLVANEVIRSRASILSETLTKWGAGNVIVTQSDPSAFGRLAGYFDVVLADAPCSGEGMFRTATALNEWSEANATLCSERQKRIIQDVWPTLKDNGLLIYSTCTFNPSENEENIKWIEGRYESEIQKINVSDYSKIQEIDIGGVAGYGFYPDKIKGEGFFISVLRKRGGEKNRQHHPEKQAELKPSKHEVESVKSWTNLSNEKLIKWGDQIWGLPCSHEEYYQLFQNLKIVKAGTLIAFVKRNDFIPSHDLALASTSRSGTFPVEELGYDDAVAYLRRDNLKITAGSIGWNIVSYRGVNLGYIKNIGNRLNNYYPVNWRIRMNIPVNSEQDLIKWEQGDVRNS